MYQWGGGGGIGDTLPPKKKENSSCWGIFAHVKKHPNIYVVQYLKPQINYVGKDLDK